MAIFSRLSGAFLLLVVAVVYYASGTIGRQPPGHPWSGLTLSLLAVTFLFFPLTRSVAYPPRLKWLRGVGLGFALAGAVAWFWSAITVPPRMP